MDTMTIPSISEMEAITRAWNTLVLNRDEFSRQFKMLGRNEVDSIHRQVPYPVHGAVFVNDTRQNADSVKTDAITKTAEPVLDEDNDEIVFLDDNNNEI